MNNNLERNAMGCHFLSLGECWNRRAPVEKSELSDEDQSGGDLSFEDIKGGLFFGAPFPLCINFSQVKQGVGMMGEIIYELMIEVGESQE